MKVLRVQQEQENGRAASLRPESTWLADALEALGTVDDEVAEEKLPAIDAATKNEAERILRALAFRSIAPTVYPTQDGEIAIYFKSPNEPGSVLILLSNSGSAECYAYAGGKSRRAHYGTSSDLPDGFVLKQLQALLPERSMFRDWDDYLANSACFTEDFFEAMDKLRKSHLPLEEREPFE